MSFLVDLNTTLTRKGFTGSQGSFPTEQAIACATRMGGVTLDTVKA